MSPPDITGSEYELVDRLIWIIDQNPDDTEGWWYNLSLMAAHNLGGRMLSSVLPDTGREAIPGTIGAELEAETRLTSRAEWFATLRSRVVELIHSGLQEPFLVQALRDELTRKVEGWADLAPAEDMKKDMREHFRRKLNDPIELSRTRDEWAAADPLDSDLTIEEVTIRLEGMLSGPVLQPMNAEDATERWAGREQWQRLVESTLSDDLIGEWAGLRLSQMMRRRRAR